MTLTEVFDVTIQPDTSTTRTCGACGTPKPFVEFYKDGTNKDGTMKYRRDCKDCYRKQRFMERKNKRAPVPVAKPRPKSRKKAK